MTTRARIDALDGWRAICVGLVIVSHVSRVSALSLPDALRSIAFTYGQLGVEFFFAISGFVICTGMLREERVSISGFYVRRFFRIVPPLLLFVAANAALVRAGVLDITAASFAHALTFTCNIGECSWPLIHTWSLAYEEQFYIVFPLAFVIAGHWRGRAVVAVLALMAAAMVLLAVVHAPHGAGAIRHFFSIGCGVAAAMHRARLEALLAKLSWPVFGLAALVPFALPLAPWSDRLPWIGYLACSPAIMLALFGSAVLGRFSWLAWPPLTAIGRASYGIYLWQQLAAADYGAPTFALNALLLAGLVPVAWLTYRFVETPLIRLGRTLAARFAAEDRRAAPA